MLKIEDLRDWLRASPNSVTENIALLSMPPTPATVVVISDTGGFGTEIEDAFDNPTFQVRCRGPGPLIARDLAHRIDGLLLNQRESFSLDGVRVLMIGRTGGAPSFLDRADNDWVTYSTNYFAKLER